GEGEAPRGGEEHLPRRGDVQVAGVGDGGAAADRPGLRGLREGEAKRAGAEGPERRGEADVPRRAGEGRRGDRGQGAGRVQVRLRQGADDRRLQQVYADDPAGAVAPRRERIPEGGRTAPLHPP